MEKAKERTNRISGWGIAFLLIMVLGLTACSQDQLGETGTQTGIESAARILDLPKVEAINLDGQKLKVVATTSVIGDVVGQVGGEAIDLITLMEPGQDPHSFEPSAGDLADVTDAHVIFVNGWNLEEGLVDDLENIAPDAILVPVSAGIEPITPTHNENAVTNSVDPHTWLDPHLVLSWVKNIEKILVTMDPDHATAYESGATAYQGKIDELIEYIDRQVAAIPAERRQLVTNHDSLGYFAKAYDFQVTGVVIPAASTIAEPSSNDLAQLVEQMDVAGVCTIFTDRTASPRLAETVTNELKNCAVVRVIPLYTGALGSAGDAGDSYLRMMKVNIDAIVEGLG